MNRYIALSGSLIAGLLSVPHAHAELAVAKVVATCGTVSPTPHAGQTYALTMDVTGKLCSSGSGGGGGGLSVTDTSAFAATVSQFTPVGGQYNSSQQTISSGFSGMFAMSPIRSEYIDTQTTNNNLYAAVTSGVGTPGSAIPSTGIMTGGSDGTNFRDFLTSTTGHLVIDCGSAGGTCLTSTVSPTPYPATAVPITISATGTTAATAGTLTAPAGHTMYLCGYSVRGNATAAANVQNTITGLVSGTWTHQFWVAPLASGLGVDEQIFTPCIPASAVSTNIVITSGAPGSGGNVTVTANGYSL